MAVLAGKAKKGSRVSGDPLPAPPPANRAAQRRQLTVHRAGARLTHSVLQSVGEPRPGGFVVEQRQRHDGRAGLAPAQARRRQLTDERPGPASQRDPVDAPGAWSKLGLGKVTVDGDRVLDWHDAGRLRNHYRSFLISPR